MGRTSPWWVADFDSSAGFLLATAQALQGEDFRRLGQPWWMAATVRAAALLPTPLAKAAFAAGGLIESIAPSRLRQVRSHDLGAWACRTYPAGPFPLVFVGASSGALVNLCAALGTPWLPQTVLIPVRNLPGRADDPRQSRRMAEEIAPAFLDANPDLSLHQMHDPVQDRLMINCMSYFRVKRLRLGADYERFLKDRLAPGGTIVLVDCRKRWPVRRISERHVFQFGAVGGLDPEEYYAGSSRVSEFLRAHGGAADTWDPPAPDDEAAEAEWGFDPALAEDVDRFAAEHGYGVARLSYEQPDGLSHLVADLYRWWYSRLGRSAEARLLVESFILTAPDRVLRTGSVPLWTVFNTEHDVENVGSYLLTRPFEEVAISLFPNGVRGIGQASLDRWREQFERAKRGCFLGVDEERFPVDLAGLANYHRAVRKLPAPYSGTPRLQEAELRAFLSETAECYPVRIEGLLSAQTGGPQGLT